MDKTVAKAKNGKVYFQLFKTTLYISTFTFGGGFVIATLMKDLFVDKMELIKEEEMINFIAIAEASPGTVSVNMSILIGYRVGGFLGALCAVLGTIIPSLVIITVLSHFYKLFKDNQILQAILTGMQSGVAAVITNVVIGLGFPYVKDHQWAYVTVILTAFVLTYFFGVNVVFIIIGCGIFGALRTVLHHRKELKK